MSNSDAIWNCHQVELCYIIRVVKLCLSCIYDLLMNMYRNFVTGALPFFFFPQATSEHSWQFYVPSHQELSDFLKTRCIQCTKGILTPWDA